MGNRIIVYKNRTNVITVAMGMDVSSDILTSEIREKKEIDSALIAEWDITFATDGVDGELVLTLDDLVVAGITETSGYMDIKRVTAGEPLPVFDKPLYVEFRNVVTE